MKIHVLQPALPKYRINFFEEVNTNLDSDFEFKVYHSDLKLGKVMNEENDYIWSTSLGPARSLGSQLFWQKKISEIDLKKGDILILSGAPRYLSNIYLLIKAKILKVKVVWWGHFKSPNQKSWRFFIRYLFMKLSDVLLFYTDKEVHTYNYLSSKKTNKFVFALNNGIDTSDIMNLRNAYSSKQRPNEIVFIGRITEKAEILTLLQAIQYVDVKDFKLNILGVGKNITDLASLVRSLNIENKVNIFGEVVDEKIISEVMNRAKLFVYPGSVGLSLIHSMAYGVPSILHNDDGFQMPEYSAFRKDHTGITFLKKDYQDLAKKINKYILSYERLDFFSKNCLEVISKTHNSKDMSSRFINVINKIVENK